MKLKKISLLKNVKNVIQDDWPRWLLLGGIGLGLILLYFWQLDSLVPALSSSEAALQQQVARSELSMRQVITTNQNFLHYTAALYLFQLLSLDSIFALRLIGVTIGLISITSFFYLVSRWHTLRVSIFATVLYASSAVTLHSARIIDESTVYLLIPAILALGWFAKHTDKSSLRYVALIALTTLILYIPGLALIALALAIWQRKDILKLIKGSRKYPLAILAGAVVVVAGLMAMSWVLRTESLLLWLGLSVSEGLPSITQYGHNLFITLRELFFLGPTDATRWVGTASLINPFVTVLFLMGLYSYYVQRRLDRVLVILLVLAGMLLLSGLGGSIDAFAIAPVIYLIAATGIALLLQQWFTVFPKNPIARMFGVACIVLAIGITLQYNLQRYFIAWPRTPEVHRAHQISPIE